MIKTTYLIVASALVGCLSACSKADNSDVFNEETGKAEVRFADPIVNLTTKSATGDITGSVGLRNFGVKVWGETYTTTNYGEGEVENAFEPESTRTLRWDNETSRWTYDNSIYWKSGLNYDFVGLAPADETAGATYSNGKMTIAGIPVVQTIGNDENGRSGIDYLLSNVATSKDNGELRDDIRLNFRHLLSRLSVYVWKKSLFTQKVTLKGMTLYMPSNEAKATYSEANHDGPSQENDTWTWTGHENVANATSEDQLTAYSSHSLTETNVEVPACSDAVTAEVNATRLDKEFFVAPTPSDNEMTLYLKATYDMEDNSGAVNEVTKFVKLETLGQLKQGYQHNLYVCLGEQTVSFSIDNVEGWQYGSEPENNITNDEGHNYGFTAYQKGFDIEGVIKTKQYGDVTFGNATVTKKDGGEESEAEIEIQGWYANEDCTGTPLAEPTASACYAKYKATFDLEVLDKSGTYTLTLKDQDDDANTAEVEMAFDSMLFTIETDETNKTFSVPIALGAVPATLAITWGDNSANTIIETEVTASNRQHSYTSTGTHKIRLLTLQTDTEKAQIPEFNFGLYPTATAIVPDDADPTFETNTNGLMLKSMDSPVLYSGATKLTAMFYGTGINSIDANLLKNYGKATSLYALFMGCESLTTVPDGLFDNLTEVTIMPKLFRDCTALASLPDGLLAKQRKCYNYYQLMLRCNNLKLNENLFIDEDAGTTRENRFSNVTELVRFDNIFFLTGNLLTSDAGTVPDLWNYTYTNKYGYYYNETNYYYPINKINDSWTNKDDIPEYWYKNTAGTTTENFTMTTTKP